MKRFKINAGTYDYSLRFCITKNHRKAAEYIRGKQRDRSIKKSSFRRVKGIIFRNYVPIIWLPRVPEKPDELATLAHEIEHATFLIMRWADIHLTVDSEEAFTHLTAKITREFWRKIKKRTS